MHMAVSYGTGRSLGPFRRGMNRRLQRAALNATHRGAEGAQGEIRATMRGRRLGGLANAVKMTSDRRRGTIRDRGDGGWSASGIVYAHIRSDRTKGALDAYTQGATILPKRGRWLAIATDMIPRKSGRYRMTPALYVKDGFESRIGPLRFVPTKRANVAYLVAENVSIHPLRPGKTRRAPKRGEPRGGRKRASIIAFVLIRVTRRNQRLDVAAIARKWQGRIPRFMDVALGTTAGTGFRSQMGFSFSQ